MRLRKNQIRLQRMRSRVNDIISRHRKDGLYAAKQRPGFQSRNAGNRNARIRRFFPRRWVPDFLIKLVMKAGRQEKRRTRILLNSGEGFWLPDSKLSRTTGFLLSWFGIFRSVAAIS